MVNPSFKQFLLLIAVAVTPLVVVSCAGNKKTLNEEYQSAFTDLRNAVASNVTDDDRRSQALGTIDEAEASLSGMNDDIESRLEDFRQLNANYDATNVEIEEDMATIRAQMKSNFQELSRLHLKLIQLMTPEEFQAVNKSRSAALDAAVAGLMERRKGF